VTHPPKKEDRIMNKRITTVRVKGDDPIAIIQFPSGNAPDSGTARIIVQPGNGKPDMGLYITRTEDGISLAPYSIEHEDGGEIDTFHVEYSEFALDDE
jgi:hypothetical protein